MKQLFLLMALVATAATGCTGSTVFGPQARKGSASDQKAAMSASSDVELAAYDAGCTYDEGCCDDGCCGESCCDTGCGDGCCSDGCCSDSNGRCGRNKGCSSCGGRGCGLCSRLNPHAGGYPEAQNFNPSPPSGQVAYPYYTVRGPRDFLRNNPPSIGPY